MKKFMISQTFLGAPNGLPVAFPNLQSLLEASSKLPSEHFGYTWETHDEPNAEAAYDHIPLEVQWEEALPQEQGFIFLFYLLP